MQTKFDLDQLIREREDQIQQLLGEVRLLKAMQSSGVNVVKDETATLEQSDQAGKHPMKTRILAGVIVLSALVGIALATPQPVRACDAGCGGIIGVFRHPEPGHYKADYQP